LFIGRRFIPTCRLSSGLRYTTATNGLLIQALIPALVLCAVVAWSLYTALLRKRPPVNPLAFLALAFLVGGCWHAAVRDHRMADPNDRRPARQASGRLAQGRSTVMTRMQIRPICMECPRRGKLERTT